MSDERQRASEERADLELLHRAERALSEIDRTQGLIDRHADILTALRIRIEGGPRRSLEELMQVTGDLEGRRARELDERLKEGEPKPTGDIADLINREPGKKRSLDDLL